MNDEIKKTNKKFESIKEKLKERELSEDFNVFIEKSKNDILASNKKFINSSRISAIVTFLPLCGVNAILMSHLEVPTAPLLGLVALTLSGSVSLGVSLLKHSSANKKIEDYENLEDYSKIEQDFYKEIKSSLKTTDIEKFNWVLDLELESSKGLSGAIKRALHSFKNPKRSEKLILENKENKENKKQNRLNSI